MPKITIELSEEESEMFRKMCFLRVTSRASSMLEESVDYKPCSVMEVAEDLREIGEVVESVRHKIVEAIFTEQVSR